MAISSTRQRNAVSEGAALGILMCGRDSLPWEKVRIDLSFEGAWRAWPHRQTFPQVDTDIRNGLDGVWAMTRADERKQTVNLYWDTSGKEIAIFPRAVWGDGEVDAAEAASLIDGGVSPEGWRELAADFLRRLER